MASSLTPDQIASELAEYELVLERPALERMATYLKLLLRWNRRINLTAIRTPRRVVRQLFAESLYLTRVLDLRGRLLDVGSGAGFPGLALKAAIPALDLTLLEANRRKCAFLKEVVRSCGLTSVQVVGERAEDWLAGERSYQADLITTRAVDISAELLRLLAKVAAVDGRAAFYTTDSIAGRLRGEAKGWRWVQQVPIPHASGHRILIGALPT